MTVDVYIDRIEASDRSDATLERISAEIIADESLSEADLAALDAWIGTYLADNDREREPSGGWEADTAPEQLPSLAERRAAALEAHRL